MVNNLEHMHIRAPSLVKFMGDSWFYYKKCFKEELTKSGRRRWFGRNYFFNRNIYSYIKASIGMPILLQIRHDFGTTVSSKRDHWAGVDGAVIWFGSGMSILLANSKIVKYYSKIWITTLFYNFESRFN